jgi:hypothetical protein
MKKRRARRPISASTSPNASMSWKPGGKLFSEALVYRHPRRCSFDWQQIQTLMPRPDYAKYRAKFYAK